MRALLLSLLLCVAPTLREGKLRFASGKSLRIDTTARVLRSVEEAERRGLPVSVKDDVRIVTAWCRVLRIRSEFPIEDEVKTVEFYDFDGNRRGSSPRTYGGVHVLQRTKRVLLDGRTSHHLNHDTLLLDENGRTVRKIVRPNTSVLAVGHSDDHQVIWIATRMMKDGQPYTDVMVVTHHGKTILRRVLHSAGSIAVTHQSRRYKFEIPAPMFPE